MAAPVITSIFPGSGPAGTLVTITGSNFTNDTSAVMFGAVSAGTLFSVTSDTNIQAYVPDTTGTVHITVTTPGGTSSTSSADQFTVAAAVGPQGGGGGVTPVVSGVSPSTSANPCGRVGDLVTITGTGFTSASCVFFGTVPVTYAVNSDTSITVACAPMGAGTVDVTVVNTTGTSGTVTADHFTYPASVIPTVTSYTPTSACETALLTFTGTNYLNSDGTIAVAAVSFYGTGGAATVPAVFTVLSATSMIVYVPVGAQNGAIRVYGGGSYATSASFTCTGTVLDYAQTTANGKNVVHYQTTTPGTTPNNAGDVWFQYGTVTPPGGSAMPNTIIGQWTGTGGTSWQATQMSNIVVTTLDAGAITSGTISAGRITSLGNITATGTISGATISGGTISGVNITGGGPGGGVGVYDQYSARAGTIYGDTGQLVLVAAAGLYLDGSTIYIGSNASVDNSGNLTVAGQVSAPSVQVSSYISPPNWDGSWTSGQGTLIQDSVNVANRWKVLFDPTHKKLQVGLVGSAYLYSSPAFT